MSLSAVLAQARAPESERWSAWYRVTCRRAKQRRASDELEVRPTSPSSGTAKHNAPDVAPGDGCGEWSRPFCFDSSVSDGPLQQLHEANPLCLLAAIAKRGCSTTATRPPLLRALLAQRPLVTVCARVCVLLCACVSLQSRMCGGGNIQPVFLRGITAGSNKFGPTHV